MFSVSLGRDLSDWSRPPLGSLNNKVVATLISLTGTSLGSALGFLSRPQIGVATSVSALNNFFRINHTFLVSTSLTGLGDVVTWK